VPWRALRPFKSHEVGRDRSPTGSTLFKGPAVLTAAADLARALSPSPSPSSLSLSLSLSPSLPLALALVLVLVLVLVFVLVLSCCRFDAAVTAAVLRAFVQCRDQSRARDRKLPARRATTRRLTVFWQASVKPSLLTTLLATLLLCWPQARDRRIM